MWRCAAILSAAPAVLCAQVDCPRGDLPAYSHNDYLNRRPLFDALSLGFRGVEADVYLVDDSLRVGHDRRAAARSGTLNAWYLEPLRSVIAKCGALGGDRKPFLFTVELKETSPAARAALTRAFALFDDLQRSGILVVLLHDADDRLVSLNYGKSIGRWWVSDAKRQRRLDAFRKQKAASPGVLLRAHNVPLDRAVYDALLSAGVDYIGTKDLTMTRRLLTKH